MTTVADAKLPWRLGERQRAIIERLIRLNEYFKYESERATSLRPFPIDWTRGGGAITAMQVGEMFNLDYYSEAERLLKGLTHRGILEQARDTYSWTLSQDALRKLGYIKDAPPSTNTVREKP